jgi:Tol biopolymer transport system component
MENHVRDLLRDIAGDIPPQGEVPPTLRSRARRRIVVNVAITLLLVLTVAVGGFDAIRSMAASSMPASPGPSIEPSSLGGPDVLYGGNDLWARDPDTGDGRTIVDAGSLPATRGSITSAAWSADRGWVAFRLGNGSIGGNLWAVGANGDGLRRLAPVSGYSQWAWSPTADEVVLAHNRDMTLIDPATGNQTDLGTTVGTNDYWGEVVHHLAWSPDGSRVAYDGGPSSGSVYSVDVQTGEHSLLVGDPAGWSSIRALDWSPDGAHLAIVYYSDTWHRQGLYVATADGSALDQVADGSEINMAWSPDGNRLAYTELTEPDQQPKQSVWTVASDGSGRSLIVTVRCCVTGGAGVVWSPEGSRVAYEAEYEGGTPSMHLEHVVVSADGTGSEQKLDELTYRSWDGGSYFCGCYG